jgi:hypothetical protein
MDSPRFGFDYVGVHCRVRHPSSVKGQAVRLPQLPLADKATIPLFLLLSVFSTPAVSQEEGRLPLFNCYIGDEADQGWLQLDGVLLESGIYSDVRFERNHGGVLELSFPPPSVEGKTAFLFSHSEGPEGYLVTLRWRQMGTDYELYSLYSPPREEGDAGGGPAGLGVSKDGKRIVDVPCNGGPYMFIEYMREATSCDAANPYGLDACGRDAPRRAVPLDVDALGVVQHPR